MISRLKFDIQPLVNEILDQLPADVWASSTTLFLDPAIGGGQFLREIEARLRAAGHSNENINGRVYGCEDSEHRVQYAKNKYKLVATLGVGDFLEKDFTTMKFDVIVGNPPYQDSNSDGRKDQASNLWTLFWKKSLDVAKPNGIVSLITPTSWLSPSKDFRGIDAAPVIDDEPVLRLWDLFSKYSSYANVNDVAQHFQGIGSTFGYVIVNRDGSGGLVFSDGSSTSLGFLPKNNYNSVSKELSTTNNLASKFTINQSNEPKLRVSVPMSRSVNTDNVEILSVHEAKPKSGSDKERLYLYVYVNNMTEAKRIQKRIITCADILNDSCRWAGFINGKVLGLIKL